MDLGELKVRLGLDGTSLKKGLDKAEKDFKDTTSGLVKVAAVTAAAVGTAFVTGLGGITLAVRSAIDTAEGFNALSQRIGVSVEELSKWDFVAKQTETSIEDIGTATRKLFRTMEEAARGNEVASRSFDRLGISVQESDGKMKNLDTVLLEVSDKFSQMEDGATKTALATELFGRSGANLIPMLNQGRDSIEEMMKQAEALGLVITKETAVAADQFNDTLAALGMVQEGVARQLAAKLLPMLTAVTDQMMDWVVNSNLVERASNTIMSVLTNVARAVKLVYDNFSILTNLMMAWAAVKFASVVVGAGVAFVKLASAVRAAGLVMAAFHAIQRMSHAGIILLVAVVAAMTGTFDDLTASVGKLKGTVANLIPEDTSGALRGALQGLGLDVSALDMSLDAANITTAETKSLQDALQLSLGETKAQTEAAKQAQSDYNAMVAEGTRIIEGTRTPAEQLQVDLARLKVLLDEGVLTWDQYNRAVKKASDDAGANWGKAGESIIASIGQVGQAFSEGNRSMARAALAAGVAQALISAYQGAARALTLPFPANLAAAASTLATGLSFVASIKSQKIPSFRGGGEVQGRGSGTSDSNLIRASHGEFVVNSRATAANRDLLEQINSGAPARGGSHTVIEVRGIPASEAGRGIRDLVVQISRAVKEDGVTLYASDLVRG